MHTGINRCSRARFGQGAGLRTLLVAKLSPSHLVPVLVSGRQAGTSASVYYYAHVGESEGAAVATAPLTLAEEAFSLQTTIRAGDVLQ